MSKEEKNRGNFCLNKNDLAELPILRHKVKLQSNRLVRISSLPSLEPRQRSFSLVSSTEKDESLTGRDVQMFRLPHLSLGAPCPVAMSMKYADLVYQNWNSNSLLPATLSGKNASKLLIAGPRPSTVSGKFFKRNSRRLGRASTHWLEHYSLLANLCTFCSLETVGALSMLNKTIYSIFCSDPFWVEMFKKMHLTPLEKFYNISTGHYNFFVNEILTTRALSGLYVFEKMFSPSLQRSVSLQTTSFSGYQLPKSLCTTGGEVEELNSFAEQAKYQGIRLLIVPVTMGRSTMELSRAHLLFRRWPPFDKYKIYLGSCRFSWSHKCFVFTFLDESKEPRIVCTSSFRLIDEDENAENQGSNGEMRELMCILSLSSDSGPVFDISRFSVKKCLGK